MTRTGGSILRPPPAQPETRCQTDHRRRRLLQILERETLKSSRLQGSRSLPSLALDSLPQQSLEYPQSSPVLTKCKPSLSPLRTQRPHPRHEGGMRLLRGVSTVRDAVDSPIESSDQQVDSIMDQIAHDAAISQAAEDMQKQLARDVARAYKTAQLEQIQAKQRRRRESKVEAQHVAEQLEWEHAQLAFIDQAKRDLERSAQCDLREQHQRVLEMERRRSSAAKIAQQFFDRLAVLEPAAAIELFTAKQQELVSCCTELMQGVAEKTELASFMQEIHATVAKQDALLRHRLRAAQREQEVRAAKAQAVADLKRGQLDEIQRHQQETSVGKLQERELRVELVKQQQAQDRRVEAQRSLKKQRDIDLSLKLQEQMRRNRAETAAVSLRIDGTMSPILRTPYWSDESVASQRESFARDAGRATTAASPERPFIFAKKTQRWYD